MNLTATAIQRAFELDGSTEEYKNNDDRRTFLSILQDEMKKRSNNDVETYEDRDVTVDDALVVGNYHALERNLDVLISEQFAWRRKNKESADEKDRNNIVKGITK